MLNVLSFVPQLRDAAVEAQVHVRWDVKTGADSEANNINRAPTATDIATLIAAPTPKSWPPASRVAKWETTVWRLGITSPVTLVGYAAETDKDYHLVLSDANNRTMIVEIPDPTLLAAANHFKGDIKAARQAFDAKFGMQMQALMALAASQPQNVEPPMIVHVSVPVRVTGIGFFDFIHGQDGVAPNGVELHPVLSLAFS